MSKYLTLYSHCIAVRGKTQGSIYDLQQGKLLFVPNSMIDLLEYMREETYLKSRKAVDSLVYFKEYVDFITSNCLGFFTTKPQNFPLLPKQYFSPEHITNAVIDYDLSSYNIGNLFNELNSLLCKHIELRIANEDININALRGTIKYTNNSTIRSIELHLIYNHKLAKADIFALLSEFKKIRTVTVHNAPESSFDYDQNIFFVADNWIEIQKKHFPHDVYIVNMKFFMESQQYNTYYHKKICISKEGHIKNSLLHDRHYGTYSHSNTLKQTLNEDKFKELWYIKPDMIEDIKESETRYATLYTQDIKFKDGKYYLIY